MSRSASGHGLLFGALGALASAQGSMNNLNFGNDKYQYYETSARARRLVRLPGTDAVHTHMTNTRLTDPEVLEFRYPVLLEDFHIRKGSGGRGKWNAGDGVRRTIRFSKKWNARFYPAIAAYRHLVLMAAETVRSARIPCAAKTAVEKLQAAMPLCSMPAKRSSSRRRRRGIRQAE
jgi:hypothetical protein